MAVSTHHDRERHQRIALERESYVVLLHLHTLADGEPGDSRSEERIARDLGFSPPQLERVLDALRMAGLLRRDSSGHGLSLTEPAIDYIEHGARRRRSVRLPH
jgi:DNA-binding IclR family transcriptional regulator